MESVTARFSLDLFCYLFICVYMHLYVILYVYFGLGLVDFGVEEYYSHVRLKGILAIKKIEFTIILRNFEKR